MTKLFKCVLMIFVVNAAGCATTPAPNSVDYPHEKIDLSDKSKAIVLIASSPKAMCGTLDVAGLRLYRLSAPPDKAENKWVGGISLNGGLFKSDLSTRRSFLQAYQLEPGEYRFELNATTPLMGSYTRAKHTENFHASAGEVRYLGNVESEGCGTIRLHFGNDWNQFESTFRRLYPGLPVGTVGISPLQFSDNN